jgi:hypothetical protein
MAVKTGVHDKDNRASSDRSKDDVSLLLVVV